ncbi:Reticulon-domain-containing protein [Gigaspora margarita]|uniref:Reticulon-like protein n=1 Tax=Gigaspora margarita TaxID=4874 RepID=A0A8H3X9Y7_GIGMA|nr:Reticulon-domain-containing protein [Gigaspora margarita]
MADQYEQVAAELKNIDVENNEQPSHNEKDASNSSLNENSTTNPAENVITEESANGYSVNEEKEEKGEPPSPPTEKEALKTDISTEKTTDFISDKVNTTTKRRKVVDNPFVAVTPQVQHLVFWENPVHSGSILAGAFAFFIVNSYLSLPDILCYLTFYALVLNLLHVLGREQLQKLLNSDVTNPFDKFLSENPVYIDRTSADKYINICINGINYLLLEGQQIALIDDPMRSFKYIIIFYVTWSIMSWMSIQSFIITALILGFTLPKAYLSNKTLVDKNLDHGLKIGNEQWNKYSNIAKHHTQRYADKLEPYIATAGLKGLIPNDKKHSEKVTKEE